MAQACKMTSVIADDLVLKGVYCELYSCPYISLKKFIQRYSKVIFGKEKHVIVIADFEYLCRFGVIIHDNKVFASVNFIGRHIFTKEFVGYLSKIGGGCIIDTDSSDESVSDDDCCAAAPPTIGGHSVDERKASPTYNPQPMRVSSLYGEDSFVVKLTTTKTPDIQNAAIGTSEQSKPVQKVNVTKRPATTKSKAPPSKIVKLANSMNK